MGQVIAASLRRRAGRALALLLGVLVATTGFTVLTGSTETARLQATGTVSEHFRGSYDILVRPAGARTEIEEQRGLVRPNFLAGTYGGISFAQWEQIAALTGVEVAAPIAMLGYAHSRLNVNVDITGAVDPSAERQLLEVLPHWLADAGLTELPDETAALVYVTRQQLVWPAEQVVIQDDITEYEYTDGVSRPAVYQCYAEIAYRGIAYEIQPNGQALPVCPPLRDASESSLDYRGRVHPLTAQLTDDGSFVTRYGRHDRLTVPVYVPMPLLVAAIDPDAEAALVGLDQAVVAGRYLAADEPTLPFEAPAWAPDVTGSPTAPVLVARQPVFDEQVSLVVGQVGTGDPVAIAGLRDQEILELVGGLPAPATTWTSRPVEVSGDHQPARWQPGDAEQSGPVVWQHLLQVGPVDYELTPAGILAPRVHPPAAQYWEKWEGDFESSPGLDSMPWLAHDTAFREVQQVSGEQVLGELDPHAVTVGIFDADLLAGVDELARVPQETYVALSAQGGDPATQELLGGQPLLPNTNPGGYFSTSPSVLLALSTLQEGLAPGGLPAEQLAPISAVRVRAAGVTGSDAVSRERVRVVAEQIAAVTGLEVDIMLGSSPAAQEVVLPAGEFGRPELRLAEEWSLKGVAVAVVEAVDRKSVVLFGLILVVCALFLVNAVAAAVRDRRRELAVLACLGWARWRLGAAIAGEVAVVGLVAGVLAAGLAPLLGWLTGVDISMGHAVLAVPVALGMALTAAVVPAWRAARSHPGAAVHPAALRPRTRARSRRSVRAMAVGNLFRVPGRTVLAVAALAVGIGGLLLLTAVSWAFHGTVTGSLLGDAVSLRVRGVDAVAVVATLLLGLVAVADVLYVGVRERAAELAALRATGWSAAAVSRLVAWEGLGIGVLGAGLGAGLGLAGAAWFAGVVPPMLGVVAAGVAAGGVVLAGLAALVPAALQHRLPMALLLAEE